MQGVDKNKLEKLKTILKGTKDEGLRKSLENKISILEGNKTVEK